jgi:hypothetical protein
VDGAVALADALALFVVGIALGAAAVAVSVVLRAPAQSRHGPSAKSAERLTAAWSLAELGAAPAQPPLLLARDLMSAGLEVPAGARVVVSGRAHLAVLRGCEVRRAAEGALPLEAAVAADGRRALLFPAGVRPGALALAVADPDLAARVAALAEAAWAAATPYVERRALADLAGEPGLPVEAEGLVAQVVARPGGAGVLLRLEDAGHAAAVHAARDDGWAGRRVRVQGRLARDSGGYTIVEADRVVALD